MISKFSNINTHTHIASHRGTTIALFPAHQNISDLNVMHSVDNNTNYVLYNFVVAIL